MCRVRLLWLRWLWCLSRIRSRIGLWQNGLIGCCSGWGADMGNAKAGSTAKGLGGHEIKSNAGGCDGDKTVLFGFFCRESGDVNDFKVARVEHRVVGQEEGGGRIRVRQFSQQGGWSSAIGAEREEPKNTRSGHGVQKMARGVDGNANDGIGVRPLQPWQQRRRPGVSSVVLQNARSRSKPAGADMVFDLVEVAVVLGSSENATLGGGLNKMEWYARGSAFEICEVEAYRVVHGLSSVGGCSRSICDSDPDELNF